MLKINSQAYVPQRCFRYTHLAGERRQNLAVLVYHKPLPMPCWGYTRRGFGATRYIGVNIQGVSSAAVYADFIYQIDDHWELFGGLRYDREEQENKADNIITVENADQLPDPTNPLLDPQLAFIIGALNTQLLQMADAAGCRTPVDADFDAFLPKLGVTYNWNSDIATHFTYQRGYRSGGVGSNIARATTHEFDPEYTDYEISFRSVWLEGDFVANVNLFYLDWRDQRKRAVVG